MGEIAVISYLEHAGKIERKEIAGRTVTYIYAPKSRRRLRRFLSSGTFERAAILGDAPVFAADTAKKAGIKICTGENFLSCVRNELIAKAAECGMGGFCTVYDDFADRQTVETIIYASSFFRNVALCTAGNDDWIYDEIMHATGLALSFGEFDGVGIVRTGRGGRQKIKIDLTPMSRTLFSDASGNVIPPSLAEAIAGDGADKNILKRLNLKIRSLC